MIETLFGVTLYFGYLRFIRRNESIVDKKLRSIGFFEMLPHKKNGMWRWNEYWWLELSFYIALILIATIILIVIYIQNNTT